MPRTAVASPSATRYDGDLALWAEQQARLLRDRRLRDLDLADLIDEVDAVAHPQRDAIESRPTPCARSLAQNVTDREREVIHSQMLELL